MLQLYREIVTMNLINRYCSIMLPYLAHPIVTFICNHFFQNTPKEIADAGRIDGCSEYGIFIRLILPIMKPAMAVMGISIGMSS